MQAGAEQEEIKRGSKRLPTVASRRCCWWRRCCCRVGGTAVVGGASPSSVFFFLFLSFSLPLFCSVLSLLFSLLLSIPLFSSSSSFRPSPVFSLMLCFFFLPSSLFMFFLSLLFYFFPILCVSFLPCIYRGEKETCTPTSQWRRGVGWTGRPLFNHPLPP
jgi:hypothetical protein